MMRYPTAVALTAAASFLPAFGTPVQKRDNGTMISDFAQLSPSKDLNWRPCFNNFSCSLVQVPLDYENEAAGTTNIAWIKWTSNSTNSSSAQDVLVNPGGPGGSGVDLVRNSIDDLIFALGSENNIVGFDPRGVKNSGPDLSCFPGSNKTAYLYDDEWGSPIDVDDSKSLAETWARAGAFGEWCSQIHSGENSTAKYANTVATATDMLHYTELLAASKGMSVDETQLWYYGASYGSVLGSTYAALFPNRVGRIILDGIVDGEDYFQGKWITNLVDADAAVEAFFDDCYAAGRNGSCMFWEESPEAIKERFDAVVEDLTKRPIIVSDRSVVEQPVIVTMTEFKDLLLQVPYSPVELFPILATILLELENRNGTSLAQYSSTGLVTDYCNLDRLPVSELEPRQFIACTDGNGRYNLSAYEDWVDHAQYLYNQSEYLGEAWAAGTSVNCRSLDIKAPESQVLNGYPGADETSHPLLFIGNTRDPVTPLVAAQKMAARFGGAGLITVDGTGHAAFSVKSDCAFKLVKQYLADASIPEEGTVCEPNTRPFQENEEAASMRAFTITKMLRNRHSV